MDVVSVVSGRLSWASVSRGKQAVRISIISIFCIFTIFTIICIFFILCTLRLVGMEMVSWQLVERTEMVVRIILEQTGEKWIPICDFSILLNIQMHTNNSPPTNLRYPLKLLC